MTVTTGGRSCSCPVSASSSSMTSPSTERISRSKWNLSATSLASVGSSRSLTIFITPSSIRALITSPDLRRIFSASSATVTDSGTRTSSRLISTGGGGGGGSTTAATAAGLTTSGGAAGSVGACGRGGTGGALVAAGGGGGAAGCTGRGGSGGAAGRGGPCVMRGCENGPTG